MVSRVFHVLSVGLHGRRLSARRTAGLVSLVGVVIMAGLLAWEQAIVRGGDLRRIDKAFFEINSWIGMVLLAVVALDIYLV